MTSPSLAAVSTSTAAPASAEDSVRAIAGAAVLAHALIDLLRREAKAISAMTLATPVGFMDAPTGFAEAPTGFAEAKDRLIGIYGAKIEMVRQLPERPETMAALGELRMLNAEVLTSAQRNAAQLQGAMDANRLLLAAMAQRNRPLACFSPVAGHC